MDVKASYATLLQFIKKYKYVVLILAIGVVLMLIPARSKKTPTVVQTKSSQTVAEYSIDDKLSSVLSQVDGAGKVQVFLSALEGEETVFQSNNEQRTDSNGNELRSTIVTVSDSQRNESGLIKQINPPTYKGAIIVCEGADDPAVQFALINAVSNVTGLGTNKISVLRMK